MLHQRGNKERRQRLDALVRSLAAQPERKLSADDFRRVFPEDVMLKAGCRRPEKLLFSVLRKEFSDKRAGTMLSFIGSKE